MRNEARNVPAANAVLFVGFAAFDRMHWWRKVARTCESLAAGLLVILIGVGISGAVEGATFAITKLYSDQTGYLQYIELRESSVDGNVSPLKDSVITVRHGDVVKRYVISSDPPPGFAAGGSLVIATISDFATGEETPPRSIPPDYVMPVWFLPTDGGTIDLDGNDPWTFGSLPIDGETALLRSGLTTSANTRSFAGGNFAIVGGLTVGTEYYNDTLGHYFVTASEPDIDAIESGRLEGWRQTGFYFGALSRPGPVCCGGAQYGLVAVPVCRYYIPPELGDSHFLSAFAEECEAVAEQYPSFVLETDAAFYVILPDKESGDCPYPSSPVYRLWNHRPDTNHRFVNGLEQRLPLIAQGWIPEGYGPAGVAWCN